VEAFYWPFHYNTLIRDVGLNTDKFIPDHEAFRSVFVLRNFEMSTKSLLVFKNYLLKTNFLTSISNQPSRTNPGMDLPPL
jgi:hypothetical protein